MSASPVTITDRNTLTPNNYLNSSVQPISYELPTYLHSKQKVQDTSCYSPISEEIYCILKGQENSQPFVYVDGDNVAHKDYNEIVSIHDDYDFSEVVSPHPFKYLYE
ncbi:hypothetical protein QTN25_004368 [Entamoeba marina]